MSKGIIYIMSTAVLGLITIGKNVNLNNIPHSKRVWDSFIKSFLVNIHKESGEFKFCIIVQTVEFDI